MRHFIEWDSIDMRVDGARLNEMARAMAASDPSLEQLQLTFSNALLRIRGAVRKVIRVPFSIDITRIKASGTTVRIPLARIAAGAIPIPAMLVRLLRNRLPKDFVHYEDPATLVLSLERFLPPFVSTSIQNVWIIDGGLAVTLGRGGADPPVQQEE